MVGPMSYVAGGAGLLAVGLGVALLLSDAKNDVLQANLDAALVNNQILKDAVETQGDSIDVTRILAEASVRREDDYKKEIADGRAETERQRREIAGLRSTEERDAVLDPYGRGLASRSRRCVSLRRLASDGTVEGCDGAGDASAEPGARADLRAGKSPGALRDNDGAIEPGN